MSDDTRATADLMDKLHGLTAAAMIKQIEAYANGTAKDDEGNTLVLPPSFFQAVSKFLKDNGIDRPHSAIDAVDKLKGQLPTLDPVDMSEFSNVRPIR